MNFDAELELLIRARYPILYVISSEETRVQNVVVEIANKRHKKVFEWSYNTGIVPAGTSLQSQKHRNAATKDPLTALDQVIEQVEPAIFIFKDFHPFLTQQQFRRHAQAQGNRAPPEGQLQDHRPDFAGAGNSRRIGKGNHRAQLSAALARGFERVAGSDHRRRQGVQTGEDRTGRGGPRSACCRPRWA